MKKTLFRIFSGGSLILMSILCIQASTKIKPVKFPQTTTPVVSKFLQDANKVNSIVIYNKQSSLYALALSLQQSNIRNFPTDKKDALNLADLGISRQIVTDWRNKLNSTPYAQQQTFGIEIEHFGFSLTFWKEKCFASPSVGKSVAPLAVTYSKSISSEPSTGLYISGSIALAGKNNSVNYYMSDGFSTQKGYSNPNIGGSVGYTFEVCSSLAKYISDK